MSSAEETRANGRAPDQPTELTTWSGFRFRVRPAERGDAAMLGEFFTHVTPQDLRFRFLTAIKTVGREFLKQMTTVDHERSENFLAFDGDTLIATAMLVADPSMERAEVAISIREDYKRRGIGWCLLDHVARHAERKGIKRIESIESRDNRAAIDLEKEMGFTARAYPGDPTLILVQKQLA